MYANMCIYIPLCVCVHVIYVIYAHRHPNPVRATHMEMGFCFIEVQEGCQKEFGGWGGEIPRSIKLFVTPAELWDRGFSLYITFAQ